MSKNQTEEEIKARKEKLEAEIKAYTDSLVPNRDISMQVINNKLKNINFLLKDNVFTHLLNHINAITDRSIAYIPVTYRESDVYDEKSGRISYTIKYDEPNEYNNYADLIVQISLYKDIGFKAVRVKSLSAINIDGSHITWNLECINDDNYLVFYSTNPNEMGKMIIMTTRAYVTMVMKNNLYQVSCFNSDKIEAFKKVFNLNEKQLKEINYIEKPNLPVSNLINKNLKHFSCISALEKLNENPLFFMKKKTHFGKHYMAYNLYDGQKIVFRDAHARNNFFNNQLKIKLPCDHDIIRNCKVQDKIAKGLEVETCQTNIYSENGWIITSYIPNEDEFRFFIHSLITELINRSAMWKNKLLKVMDKIKFTLSKVIDKVIEIKEKLKDKLCYFRPLHLLDYICCTDNVHMWNYFLEHSYMNKFYIKC